MDVDRERESKRKGYKWCADSIGGSWAKISEDQMGFKPISGGLTNYLYLCWLPSTIPSPDAEPRKVLLRVYGDIAKDREFLVRNTTVFAILSAKNLGPHLYAVGSEGRLEEYIPTNPLRTKDLADKDMSEQIAKKIALFHNIKDMPLNKEPTFLEEKMLGWIDQCENVFTTIPTIKDETAKKYLQDLQKLDFAKEVKELLQILARANSPVVFSHNDLQEGNILYMKDCPNERKRLTFIDWEYCSYNNRGFDFANHFCEWCYDYTHEDYPCYLYMEENYPSKQQQFTFFRSYLAVSGDNPTEEVLNSMSWEADIYTLASHFFWGLWSIVQRELSDIKFGYLEYASCRLECYFKQKAKILAELSK